MDLLDGGPAPKRGDLVQTNVGDRRERTWPVLHAQRVRRRQEEVPRYRIHMARWWELEAETRQRLFRSAERNGGQEVHFFFRYGAKKTRTFEQYMRRSSCRAFM